VRRCAGSSGDPLARLPAHRESDATFVLASLMAAGFTYALGRALVNQGKRKEATPHIKLARSLRPRASSDGDALE